MEGRGHDAGGVSALPPPATRGSCWARVGEGREGGDTGPWDSGPRLVPSCWSGSALLGLEADPPLRASSLETPPSQCWVSRLHSLRKGRCGLSLPHPGVMVPLASSCCGLVTTPGGPQRQDLSWPPASSPVVWAPQEISSPAPEHAGSVVASRQEPQSAATASPTGVPVGGQGPASTVRRIRSSQGRPGSRLQPGRGHSKTSATPSPGQAPRTALSPRGLLRPPVTPLGFRSLSGGRRWVVPEGGEPWLLPPSRPTSFAALRPGLGAVAGRWRLPSAPQVGLSRVSGPVSPPSPGGRCSPLAVRAENPIAFVPRPPQSAVCGTNCL